MKAKCKDDSHTFRNMLTVGKDYEVIRLYKDPYAGYPMIEIINDSEEKFVYRADRFELK